MKKMVAMVLAVLMVTSLSQALGESKMSIGIIQFAEHPSLDNCREGFIAGLAEEGFVDSENITVSYQNAQADMGINAQIAQGLADKNVSLMLGIATPSAMAAFNAAEPKGIPVVYCAVTDPVAAQLANEQGLSEKNVTGTSDKLPVELQLQLIRAVLPEATKIGILYTTSEVNSESAIKEYEALAPSYGFEIVPMGIATGSDIALAVDALLPKVDCLNNLTDNTIVSYLPMLLEKANAAKKPVFGSEVEQVKNGCIAAQGLDYVALGKQTGKLAARVLRGENAGDIPFELITESALYINESVFESLGIAIPEAAAERAISVMSMPD